MARSVIKYKNPFGNKGTQTLGGDVINRTRDIPFGISFFPTSNNPTNKAPGNDWGSYIIFKFNDEKAILISVDSKLAVANINNLSTATSITWKVIDYTS